LNAGGIVALLLITINLLLSGKVVPTAVLKTIIRETVRQVMKEMIALRYIKPGDNKDTGKL
jgi:hypothetical protein